MTTCRRWSMSAAAPQRSSRRPTQRTTMTTCRRWSTSAAAPQRSSRQPTRRTTTTCRPWSTSAAAPRRSSRRPPRRMMTRCRRWSTSAAAPQLSSRRPFRRTTTRCRHWSTSAAVPQRSSLRPIQRTTTTCRPWNMLAAAPRCSCRRPRCRPRPRWLSWMDYVGMQPTQQAASQPTNAAKPPGAVHSDSEDSMPPLEYVGASSPERTGPAAAAPETAAAEDDDDDMPPLEYVAASGDASFLEGDTVVLKGLSGKAELNGQRGTVLPFLKRANGRLDVRLQGTGEKVSVKPVNLEKVSSSVPAVAQAQPPAAGAAGDDADDDDDMPPLEYVGVGSKPQPAAGPPAAAGDDGDASDDSMPPLDYAGTAAPASQEQPPTGGEPQTTFSVGDMVVLTGLRTTQLNGERARVIQELDAETSRVQVKLLGSGKKMLVKPINIQKAAAVSSDEEESGKRPAPGPPNTGTASADTTKNPEALLEQMRQAMQSTSVAPVLEALAHVEAAEGMEWGDLLPRKKQLLKKLRAKKRKLQPQEDESQAPPDTPERGGGAPDAASKSKATSDSSAHSEKDWVVLGKKGATTVAPAAAAPGRGLVRTPAGPKAAPPAQSTAGAAAPAAAAAGSPKPTQSLVRQWCEELQLPASLAEALEAEEVADPQELTGVPDEELSELAKHMKIGPKGRFMKAIRKMKALEQAELGSTCGSIA
uniref:Uncharacterized protein n=1 Tax=Alexandrium monilatum TaxID=311494 RepID=A0A7S4S1E9_9DINO